MISDLLCYADEVSAETVQHAKHHRLHLPQVQFSVFILTPILEPVQTFLTPNHKLSFFPFTLYFSSFTKAEAKVYNISSSSSSLSLSEVMSAQF